MATKLIDSEETLQRFQNEATLLSSFDHPNIVRFLSYGATSDGRYYMVLEYIEGQTLARILEKEEALSSAEAMPFFKDICMGLAYAHEKGVIHRDLKPSNVISGSSGNTNPSTKILDFGVFKNVIEDQSLTKTGSIIGSVNYMSPEQCRSEVLDQRSDIYSLGCLIYETLVGKAPMQAESDLATMSNHLTKTIKTIPAKHGVSRELEQIVLKCLAKNRESRFSTANELLKALELAQTKPLAKAPKHPLLLAGLGAGLVLIVSTILFLLKPSQTSLERQADTPQMIAHKTRLRNLKNSKRPPTLPTQAGLQDLEDWIEANIDEKHVNASDLAKAYSQAKDAHNSIRLGGGSPYGERIEELLKKRIVALKHIASFAHEASEAEDDLVDVQLALEEDDAAKETLKQIMMKREDEGPLAYKNRLSEGHWRLALIEARNKNYKAALEHMAKRTQIAIEMEDQQKLEQTLVFKARTEIATGQLEEAKKDAASAKKIFLEYTRGHFPTERDASNSLLDVFMSLNEPKQVIELADLMGKQCDLNDEYHPSAAWISLNQAHAYQKLNDFANANKTIKTLRAYLKAKNHLAEFSDSIENLEISIMDKSNQRQEIPSRIQSYLAERKNSGDIAAYLNSLLSSFLVMQSHNFDTKALLAQMYEAAGNYESIQPKLSGYLLTYVGHDFREHGKIDEALNCYLRAEKDLNESKEKDPLAGVFNGLARVYIEKKDLLEARKTINKALSIMPSTSLNTQYAIEDTLGLVLAKESHLDEAINIHKLLMSKLKNSGNHLMILSVLNSLVSDYKEKGSPELAMPTINETVEILTKDDKLTHTILNSIISQERRNCESIGKSKEAEQCAAIIKRLKNK